MVTLTIPYSLTGGPFPSNPQTSIPSTGPHLAYLTPTWLTHLQHLHPPLVGPEQVKGGGGIGKEGGGVNEWVRNFLLPLLSSLKPIVSSVRRLLAPVRKLARRERHTHRHTQTRTHTGQVLVAHARQGLDNLRVCSALDSTRPSLAMAAKHGSNVALLNTFPRTITSFGLERSLPQSVLPPHLITPLMEVCGLLHVWGAGVHGIHSGCSF